MNYPFLNAINDNIIIYNGDLLPITIQDTVTKSIINLFNKCNSIYDQKIYRSPHCIWFILSKNISEYYIIMSLKNVFAKATNKNILQDVFRLYPNILENTTLYNSPLYFNFNFIHNLTNELLITTDNTQDTFDLLE
jgi:hypothetical protein